MDSKPLFQFEIIARDVTRTQAFYERVLGWHFENAPEAEGREGEQVPKRIDTGSPIIGTLSPMPRGADGPMLNLFFLVDEIDATLKEVEGNGGNVIFSTREIPDVGLLGMFADPDGLQIGIMQMLPADVNLRIKEALRSGQNPLGGLICSSDEVALALANPDI